MHQQRSQFIEDTVEPSYLPGIISLFIMCIGIIRNNALVDERAWAESNPGHWVRHALLHMAAECVNHSATKAGQGRDGQKKKIVKANEKKKKGSKKEQKIRCE